MIIRENSSFFSVGDVDAVYTVRKVLTDFAVYVTGDAIIAKLLTDEIFSKIEENRRIFFCQIQPMALASSDIFF